MKLQTKIMFLLAFVVLIFILSVLSFQYIGMKQRKLFMDENQKSHNKVIDQILNTKSAEIDKVVKDYSGWDDMVYYAEEPDSSWTADNIDITISSFSLSFTSVYNTDKELVYTVIDSSDLENYVILEKDLIERCLTDTAYCHFYKNIDNNIFEISGAYIDYSENYDDRLSAHGYLFCGKQIDSNFVDELSLLSNFSVECYEYESINTINLEDKSKITNIRYITDENNENIAFYKFCTDNPLNKDLKSFFLITLLINVIALLSLTFFFLIFRKLVTQPVNRISKTLDTEDSGFLSEYVGKKNEFGKISNMIDTFFRQKQELVETNKILKNQKNEIKQANEILFQQKEEIKAQSDELFTVNEELENTIIKLKYQTEALDASASVIIFDINGIISYINNKYCQTTDFKPNEIISKHNFFEDSAINNQDIFEDLIKEISVEKKVWRGEMLSISKKGIKIWEDVSVVPFLDLNNQITQYLAIKIDISQRKITEIQLAKKNKETTDSIFYANNIQEAIINQSLLHTKSFKDFSILFKPRNIVSGDFYFIRKSENLTYFTAADCTGHGVPGAFMSLLGTAFLNEIISKEENLKANQILNKLRDLVKNSLGQTGKSRELRNGMDMAFCIFDEKTNEIQYSGAYNSLYIVHNSNDFEVSELEELKADIQPIGIYPGQEKEFTLHTFQIKPNDTLYLTTDGYKDQFGGAKKQKLKSNRLKELIINNQKHNLNVQKQILDDFFINWQGDNPQIDDVLILALRF